MTIPEYSAKIGKSKQAVYSRLKKNNLTAASLIDSDGNLTEAGLEQLDRLYPEFQTVKLKTPLDLTGKADKAVKSSLSKLDREMEDVKKQNEEIKQAMTKVIQVLSRQNEIIQQQSEALKNLTVKYESGRRLTLRERITGRISKMSLTALEAPEEMPTESNDSQAESAPEATSEAEIEVPLK